MEKEEGKEGGWRRERVHARRSVGTLNDREQHVVTFSRWPRRRFRAGDANVLIFQINVDQRTWNERNIFDRERLNGFLLHRYAFSRVQRAFARSTPPRLLIWRINLAANGYDTRAAGRGKIRPRFKFHPSIVARWWSLMIIEISREFLFLLFLVICLWEIWCI